MARTKQTAKKLTCSKASVKQLASKAMPVLYPVDIGSVELPGVDVTGQAPQTIEIDDLNILQPNPPLIITIEEPTVPKWSMMNQHRLHNQ
jgi:hypothetical protein